MNKKSIALMFLFMGIVFGQLNSSAVQIGTASSNAIHARGLEVIGLNPANLGYGDNPRLNIQAMLLPGFSMQLNNNSLTPNWVNDFLNSGELNKQKLDDLMGALEDDVLEINPTVYLPGLGVQLGQYAFMIKPELVASVGLPSDLIRFPFEGLAFGDEITFEKAKTAVQSTIPISFATSFPLPLEKIPQVQPFIKNAHVGVGGKLLTGLAYSEFTFIDGGILSQPDAMSISTHIEGITALGGFGFALDAGVAVEINDKINANLSINNLLGQLTWSNVQNIQFETEGTFNRSEFEEIADYSDAQYDSLEEAMVKVDTSFSGDPITSTYPAYILAGFSYDNLIPNLHIMVSYRQYFTDELGFSTTPRLSGAVEYKLGKIFPIRAGISVGGPESFQWSTGVGLHVGFYHLDIGFSQMGGFFNNSKGFAFSIGSSLWF